MHKIFIKIFVNFTVWCANEFRENVVEILMNIIN